MLTTIIIFILVLSLLVFAHELGHFVTALRFGVRADEFGFGFPPRAIGFYKNRFGRWRRVTGDRTYESLAESTDEKLIPKKGSTIYSINWLPIGGFVKIKGENGDGAEEPDSFGAKKIRQRIIILSAGVIMNVILAWLLFSFGYMVGLPQSTEDIGRHARVSAAQVAIVSVMPESPAAKAGVEQGDFILDIDGQPVATEKEVQEIIGGKGGQEVKLNLGGEKPRQVAVVPVSSLNGTDGRAAIGVGIMAAGTVSYPILDSFWEGARTTAWTLKEIFVSFGGLIADLFRGRSVGEQFAGPVGIASITGQAARLGFVYLLQFTALLSLNLAVINILPFPALDGGRILFLLVEKVKGKPVRRELEALIHNIGFILLIALVVFITYKDIARLF